ncbi:MAG: glutamate-5-semialdehyde dehydrogenase [Planctomycetes bacterium]|nr:glutamate-5-semialdehyde dehydrogenase [Planctomycetota bacterium]
MSQTQTSPELSTYCLDVARRAKQAAQLLVSLSTTVKNRWIQESANRLLERSGDILRANQQDLAMAESFGLTTAEVDRLLLREDRIAQMADGLRELAALPDPVGEIIEGSRRPNGLEVRKVRVPLGVLFFIYESRPNVTADAAAIGVKSGNAIILRGGKEASHSSDAIVNILREVANDTGLPSDVIQLVSTADRNAVGHFLTLSSYIDLVIPRGGENLIQRVVSEATMPVLKHFDGNCHVYVDASADIAMALSIVRNSKCQRMGVCNAMESLVVHTSIAKDFLSRLRLHLDEFAMEYRGDELCCHVIPEAIPAEDSDWRKEFLGPVMSVKTVPNIEAAIAHINRYSSKHTDAIVTSSMENAHRFAIEIDSSAVMINASTRFNDGGQLGMGAEIGISTDKFHARGPCGLRELTTYKYIVEGSGHIRQ